MDRDEWIRFGLFLALTGAMIFVIVAAIVGWINVIGAVIIFLILFGVFMRIGRGGLCLRICR